jgi:hypothetical protein
MGHAYAARKLAIILLVNTPTPNRYLKPMARAAQLRGVAPMPASSSGSAGSDEAAARPDDDVVLLLERAKDSKSAALRSDYLQK